MIEDKLVTVLTGASAVTTLINSTRIYPVVLPQQTAYPAIVYHRGTGNPENALDGYSGLYNAQMIIESFALTYKEAKQLADKVHRVINASTAVSGVLISDADLYEPSLDLYRIAQDWSFWERST